MTPSARRTTLATLLLAAATTLSPPGASAQADKATVEALESYFEFSEYASGSIATEQIPAGDWAKLLVLDVRDAGQFAKGHIPGAVNIEWRRVFAERAKLPKDKTILAYCNSGTFSGQVAMALRMAGFENVRILRGGYGEWQATQARSGK